METNKHEDCERGFYVTNLASYATPASKKEIMFGMYHIHGGTTGEMAMEWRQLIEGDTFESPQLKVFYDGWSALATMPDLLTELAKIDHDNRKMTQDTFMEILLRLGFQDLTQYPGQEEKKVQQEQERLRKSGLAKLTDEERDALNL